MRSNSKHTACSLLLLAFVAACSGSQQQTADSSTAAAFTSTGAEADYERGIQAQQAGDMVTAEQFFRSSIGANERYLAAYIGLGQVLWAQRQYAESLATFDRAIAIRERSREGNLGRARALLSLERYDDAIEAAEIAISLGATIDGRLVSAQAMSRLGHLEDAIVEMQAILDEEPGRLDVRIELGNLLISTGRAQEAVPLLERGARRSPQNLEACVAVAELHHSRNIWDRAIEWWQRCAQIDNTSGYLMARLGEAQLEEGSHLMAIQSLEQAIALDSSLIISYIGLGRAELLRGSPDAALRSARSALQIDGDNLDALVLMATIHQQRGQPNEAINTLQAILRNNPQAVSAAHTLASLYLEQRRGAEALNTLTPLLEIIHEHPDTNLLLINAYIQTGRSSEALELLVSLMADHPTNAQLHREVVEMALTNPDQSIIPASQLVTYAEQALSLSGGQRTEFRLTLINALIFDGQTRQALRETRSALNDAPNHPDLLERLRQLQ